MKQPAAGMKASRIRGQRPTTANDSQPKNRPKPTISRALIIGLTCVNQFLSFQSGFFLVRSVVFGHREGMYVIFAEMKELWYHITHFDRVPLSLRNARRDSIQVLFGRRRSVLVGRAQQGTVLVNKKS